MMLLLFPFWQAIRSGRQGDSKQGEIDEESPRRWIFLNERDRKHSTIAQCIISLKVMGFIAGYRFILGPSILFFTEFM